MLPNPMRGDVGERRAMLFGHSGSMEATMLKYVSCEHGVLKIGIKSERNSTGVARTFVVRPGMLVIGEIHKVFVKRSSQYWYLYIRPHIVPLLAGFRYSHRRIEYG